MRTIKEEHLSLTEYRNMAAAREQIANFIEDVRQRRRIHLSLGYQTPEEYEERWNKEQLNKTTKKLSKKNERSTKNNKI